MSEEEDTRSRYNLRDVTTDCFNYHTNTVVEIDSDVEFHGSVSISNWNAFHARAVVDVIKFAEIEDDCTIRIMLGVLPHPVDTKQVAKLTNNLLADDSCAVRATVHGVSYKIEKVDGYYKRVSFLRVSLRLFNLTDMVHGT